MITATQKKTAESIVNVFETGRALGDYGQVTLIRGDTGHLTFGRSQATLGSGSLGRLLERYCSASGARFGLRLAAWLDRCRACDVGLDRDETLHNLLRASADDPVMRDTQDAYFDEFYWRPAEKAAVQAGIREPLGVAVVYDGFIHGGWRSMRDRCNAQVGRIAAVGERRWIEGYVAVRRAWLAGHRRTDLHPTVYRMDAFRRLIDQGYWALELPLIVRDCEISAASLAALPPGSFDGPQPGSRVLALQSPIQRGLDVRLMQLGLSLAGVDVRADGLFGRTTARCLRDYQQANGLPPTGVAEVALIAQLTSGFTGAPV